MRDLVRNCLRMRPERIIVGEVRGDEAFDLLQAMNTGHDGSMGTLHANSPRDALARLESMILMGGFTLPAKTIREMICASIDVIARVFCRRRCRGLAGLCGSPRAGAGLWVRYCRGSSAGALIRQFQAAPSLQEVHCHPRRCRRYHRARRQSGSATN